MKFPPLAEAIIRFMWECAVAVYAFGDFGMFMVIRAVAPFVQIVNRFS